MSLHVVETIDVAVTVNTRRAQSAGTDEQLRYYRHAPAGLRAVTSVRVVRAWWAQSGRHVGAAIRWIGSRVVTIGDGPWSRAVPAGAAVVRLVPWRVTRLRRERHGR